MTSHKNNPSGAGSKSAGVSSANTQSNGKSAVPDSDSSSPLSPEWFRAVFRDAIGEYLGEAFRTLPRILRHRPGDQFMMALSYACERDAEIAQVTSGTGSGHWVVRKNGTIISVFPELEVAEHPDLEHLSDDIFIPARALAEQLPKSMQWPTGRRARKFRLAQAAERKSEK
jgi:hypothetical protein